jgi:tetratricopeptide (TPR) repeat protein
LKGIAKYFTIKILKAESRKKKVNRIITIASSAAALFAMGLSWFAFTKMNEAENNKSETKTLLLESNYKSKNNYLGSYYEILKATFDEVNSSKELSDAKVKILSTFYMYADNIQNQEISEDQSKYTFAFTREKYSLTGHNKPVNSVSFSPDGKLFASGSNDKTIKLWDVDIGKSLSSLYNALAYIEYKDRKFKKAITYYEKALGIDSGNAKAIYYWGISLYRMGQIEKANEKYLKAKSLAPDDDDYLFWSARKLVKKENPTPGELEDALYYARRSNALKHNNAAYISTLAEVYLKQKDKFNADKYNTLAKNIARKEKKKNLLKDILEREKEIQAIK